MGEARSPDALRNASDQFFEWTKPLLEAEPASAESAVAKSTQRVETVKPVPKLRPRFIVEAVTLLAADTAEGKVSVGGLGSYLKRADPSFSPKNYGHSGSLDMLKTYDLLKVQQEIGGHWTVRLADKPVA